MSKPQYKHLVLGLDDEVPFGKHKGADLREVLEVDLGWVTWALENIPNFDLMPDAEAYYHEMLDVRRPRGVWVGR